MKQFGAKRVTGTEDITEFSSVLECLLRVLPPLPLHPELVPEETYEDQQGLRYMLDEAGTALVANFEHNCQVKHFASVCARLFNPVQVLRVATEKTCRNLVWAFDADKITELDVISYCYMLVLASSKIGDDNSISAVFTEEKVLTLSTVDSTARERALKTLSSTLLVFKTEVGRRRSTYPLDIAYELIQIAELITDIVQMEPSPTEELVFEEICQRATTKAVQIFNLTYKQVTDSAKMIKQHWVLMPDEYDSQDQQLLLTVTAASLPLVLIQNYIELV